MNRITIALFLVSSLTLTGCIGADFIDAGCEIYGVYVSVERHREAGTDAYLENRNNFSINYQVYDLEDGYIWDEGNLDPDEEDHTWLDDARGVRVFNSDWAYRGELDPFGQCF